MEKEKKGKTRTPCGDCYYNGNCHIYLRQCPYLKKYYRKEKELTE